MEGRSQLSNLLIAVGPKDKENLASPDVILKCKSRGKDSGVKVKKSLKVQSINNASKMIKNQINNITSEQLKTAKPITAEDLTTTGNPGEAYWEQLLESRRIALEATLKENVDLHTKIMELEYENTKLKSMLAEAKTAIGILTELVEENESGVDNDQEGEDEESEESEHEPDDSLNDASFTSL